MGDCVYGITRQAYLLKGHTGAVADSMAREAKFMTSYYSGVRDLVHWCVEAQVDPLEGCTVDVLNRFFVALHTTGSPDQVRTARNAAAANPVWGELLGQLPRDTQRLLRADARLAKEPRYMAAWPLELVFKAIREYYTTDDGLIITARRCAVTLARIYLLARGCDAATLTVHAKPLPHGVEVQLRRKMKRHYRMEEIHAVREQAL